VEHPSTEASKNTDPRLKPACTPSCIIGTTEAAKEADATIENRHPANGHIDDNAHCSVDVKVDDPDQAPKVYTVPWADIDTDTKRARSSSTTEDYHEMAPRRRRRHRKKHGPRNMWIIGLVLAAVLLVFSIAHLLLIIRLLPRLLNQK
jgi:hypothetical protein